MTNDSKTTDGVNDETPRVCSWCDKTLREDETEQCATCDGSMCDECAYTCGECGARLCENCKGECAECGYAYCPSHLVECSECPRKLCGECAAHCTNCDCVLCENCAQLCDECEEYVCADCRYACENCDETLCGDCVRWSDQNDCAYCEDCMPDYKYPEYSMERRSLMNSHEHMFTVGLEIEINGGHDHARIKRNPLIAGYCTDGSLYHREGLEYQTDILFSTDIDALAALVESIHCDGSEPERAGGHMHVRRTSRATKTDSWDTTPTTSGTKPTKPDTKTDRKNCSTEPCPTGHHTHATRKTGQGTDRPPPCPGRPNARHPRPRKNGHRPDGRRGRSDHTTFRPLATAAASRTIARPDLPAPSGPILPDTLTRVLTSRARRRPTSGQARKWVISTHGRKRTIRASADGRSASRDADPIPTTERAPPCPVRRGRETERRTDAPPFLIFF